MKISVISLIIFIGFSNNAFAYLDPGTGSAILSAIVALIASGLAIINSYWTKIKNLYKRLFSKEKKYKN